MRRDDIQAIADPVARLEAAREAGLEDNPYFAPDHDAGGGYRATGDVEGEWLVDTPEGPLVRRFAKRSEAAAVADRLARGARGEAFDIVDFVRRHRPAGFGRTPAVLEYSSPFLDTCDRWCLDLLAAVTEAFAGDLEVAVERRRDRAEVLVTDGDAGLDAAITWEVLGDRNDVIGYVVGKMRQQWTWEVGRS